MTENAPTPTTTTNNNSTTPVFMGNPAPRVGNPRVESEEELLLNNPKAFVERVKNEVRQETLDREAKERNAKKFWDGFYQENPDLKDVDWHVQSVVAEKLPEWHTLPEQEGKKKLADEARRRIDLLKNKAGMKKEEITSTTASTFSSSGSPAPSVPAQEKAPSTFIDEFKEMRKSRQKRR